MFKRSLSVASLVLATLISACGGGGGGANGGSNGTNSGTMNNVVTVGTKSMKAGQSAVVAANATMRGFAPTSMVWSVAPLNGGSASDAPSISDPNCVTATYTPPPFATSSGVGSCQIVLSVPATAKAASWRITNTASSSGGTISDYVDMEVTALPVSGFQLVESLIPVSAYVGRSVNLNMPFSVNPGTTVANIKYKWTAATGNPATLSILGSTSSSASVIPTAAGQYSFNVAITADVNGYSETATGVVVVEVHATNVVDLISAGDTQIVASGTVVKLTGAIANQDPSMTYESSWSQLSNSAGGPVVVSLLNKNSANATFISPSTAGTYGFEYKVVKTLADGSQAITTAQTSVVVQANPNGVFTVSAGDVQSVSTGDVVSLKGTVGVQNGPANVSYVYNWTQVGASPVAVALANASTPNASFIPTIAGTYAFNLTVSVSTPSGVTTVSGNTQVVVTAVSVPVVNFALTANAGPMQAVSLNTITTLTGSQTSQGITTGVTYAYQWVQNGLTPAVVALSNSNSPSATFFPTVPGVYEFRLTVVATLPDLSTRTASAIAQVIVGSPNASTFSVSAGDAQVVALGSASSMKGTVVTQGDFTGATFSYAWTQVGSAPASVIVSNANALTASFVPTVAGTYTFQLTVTALQNGVSTSHSAQTQVSTSGSPGAVSTFAISASAGSAQSVLANVVTTLQGAMATQGTATGVTYTYAWTQIGSTPAAVTVSNANNLTASFFPTVDGVYGFRLTITATLPDATTQTAVSETQVIVGGMGTAFTVSAGDAQVVKVSTAATMKGAVVTQGTLSGAVFSYAWTQVGATPAVVTPSNANSLTASFVPTVVGTYTFMLTVTCVQSGVTTTHTAQTQILVTP